MEEQNKKSARSNQGLISTKESRIYNYHENKSTPGTPLQNTTLKRKFGHCQGLVDTGADKELKDKSGLTPLMPVRILTHTQTTAQQPFIISSAKCGTLNREDGWSRNFWSMVPTSILRRPPARRRSIRQRQVEILKFSTLSS